MLSIRYKCRMIRLTDEQWKRIRDHFPEENIADGRPGRKPTPTRCVLEAVLWILNTGAQWHMLPQSYPNYKTVHRRFQTWCRDEVLRRVLTDVANELRDRGALNEEECFIDATFVMAKGGGSEIGTTKRGKGMKIMAIVDRHGLPLSVSTHAANHHEVRLNDPQYEAGIAADICAQDARQNRGGQVGLTATGRYLKADIGHWAIESVATRTKGYARARLRKRTLGLHDLPGFFGEIWHGET